MEYVLVSTLFLVGARLLSTGVWFCFTPEIKRPSRVVRIGILVGMLLLSAKFAPSLLYALMPTALALLYFAALVPGVYAVANEWSPTGWLGFAGSIGAWMTLSILVPMHFVSGDIKLPFIAKGFEFALAAHSYVADAKQSPERSLRQCFFFLLVNPVLVFHQFGKRTGPPKLTTQNVARCALGIGTVAAYFGVDFIIDRLSVTQQVLQVTQIRSFADYGQFLGATGALAASTYLAHSGTASIQIGTMRLAGYVVPERYNYAFLAVTPADAWRRWNTYVSSWFSTYCLVPSMVGLRRRTRMPSLAIGALSIWGCFLVSGLIHATAATSVPQATVTVLCFVSEAMLVMLWVGASKVGRGLTQKLPTSIAAVVLRIAPVGSWALRVQVSLIILSLLFPTLTGGQAGR